MEVRGLEEIVFLLCFSNQYWPCAEKLIKHLENKSGIFAAVVNGF